MDSGKLFLLAWILSLAQFALAAPPTGFVVDSIGGNFDCVVGALPLPDGRVLAWERTGKLWMINKDGQRVPQAVLDISDEVQGGGDSGLLGLAVHPAFPATPHVYLLYVVDRHHLLYAGTPSYDPKASLYYKATIGRITRYTLNAATNYTSVLQGSRKVLLGSGATDGIPVLFSSHTVGSLLFGMDGSLLAATGDNANYSLADTGGAALNPNVTTALADGIIRPEEDVGAFRSQMIDSLCGKVLRLDPETGLGLPGNPWFDPSLPGAARSRVWLLGLRNPYRMTLVPGTGSHDSADAQPGTLLIGDVGLGVEGSEKIFMAKRGGLNMGWPLFEGFTIIESFWKSMTLDRSMPLPDGSLLPFADRIQQEAPTIEPFVASNRIAQAENNEASSDGGAQVVSNRPGFLGFGFRSLWKTRYVEFALSQSTTASSVLALRYSLDATSATTLSVTLDGAPIQSDWSAPPTGSPTAWRVARIPLGTLATGPHVARVISMTGSAPLAIDAAWLEGASTDHILPPFMPTFVCHQPLICWRNEARTPGFNALGAPTGFVVGSPGGATGENFSGSCVIAGPWVDFPSWPAQYRGIYMGDYSAGWIRRLDATLSGQCGSKSNVCRCAGAVQSVDLFDSGVQGLVGLYADPSSESLLSAQWVQLKRYRWLPTGSLAPEISLQASSTFGASPLAVQFDASASRDPEGQSLTFDWDFGDGSPHASTPSPSHLFVNPGTGPGRFDVLLRVRDAGGAESTRSLVIGIDNTPPVPDMLSPVPGQLFSTRRDLTVPLIASATDHEHDASQLLFEWQIVLHHNSHVHPEPIMQGECAEALLQAVHCNGVDSYWYEVTLTVRDPGGLAASRSVRIDPDCQGRVGCPGDCDGNGFVDTSDLGLVLLSINSSDPVSDVDGDGSVDTADVATLLLLWGECPTS